MQKQENKKPWLSREHSSMAGDVTELYSQIVTLLISAAIVAMTFLIPVNTDPKNNSGNLLTRVISASKPEPLEMPQYVLAIVLIAVLFYIAYYYFNKHPRRLSASANNLLSVVLASGIAAASFISFVMSYRNYDYFDEMFYPTLFMVPFFSAGIMLLLLRTSVEDKQKRAKIVFFAVLAVIFVYSIYRISAYDFSLQIGEFNIHHYYACWYPIAKVDAGQTIGVDFRSIYGFYPYLVIPVLKLLGGVNQHSSTILITMLFVVIAFSYSLFSYKFIKNKYLACVVAALCSLYGPFSLLGDKSIGGVKLYLQFNPLRTLFPAIVLIAVVIRSTLKSRRSAVILNIIMCIVGGLAIFWNFEMGVISALIWAAYNVYDTAVEKNLFSRDTFKRFLIQAVIFAVSALMFVVLVMSVTYFRSGRLLTLHELFFGILSFAGTGFNLHPVQYRLWVVLAIVFVGAFITVAPFLTKYKQAGDERVSLDGLFAIGVTGIGTFIYFIGRSDITISLMYLPYAVMACGILCEYYYRRLPSERNPLSSPGILMNYIRIFFCCVVIAGIVLPSAYNIMVSLDARYGVYHNADKEVPSLVQKQADFIKAWADKYNDGEYPNILLSYSIFVDEQLGRKPTEHVCEEMDWYFLEDARTYFDFLNSHSDESFAISNHALAYLKEDFGQEWKDVLSRYNLSAEDGEIYVHIYVPKTAQKNSNNNN